MSTKPESYEEFLGNMIGSFENTDKAENMVIMDNVRPNKNIIIRLGHITNMAHFQIQVPYMKLNY